MSSMTIQICYYDHNQTLTSAIHGTNLLSGEISDVSGWVGSYSKGIIWYYTSNNKRYFQVVFYFTSNLSNMPPKVRFQRVDTWADLISPIQCTNGTITYEGITYNYIQLSGFYYDEQTELYYSTSGNETLYNFRYFGPGSRCHHLGQFDSNDGANARLLGLQYLLSEQPPGQGTATLTLKAPGQNLIFTSALLAKSVTQYISGNDTVNISGESVGITLEGGKGDEIAIYDGDTLLRTVTFGSTAITANTVVPLNRNLTFTSTKFKYGDNNTYFSKTLTVTTAGSTVKVMPDGALYWYGNECESLTGGWSIHNVGHHTFNGSDFSVLTAPIIKNKNSLFAGWKSSDLSNVPSTYYYTSSVSTNNAINYSHTTAKIHIINSKAVKEITSNAYGVLLGCGYNTANSGNTYWGIGLGTALDYPNEVAGQNVQSDLYLSGSNSSTGVYFAAILSTINKSSARQYGNLEFDYYVLE